MLTQIPVTNATLAEFEMYCAEHGVNDGVFNEDENSFYCFTKTTRMTGFLMEHFTQWKDTFNNHSEYTGYELRLSKKDVHNINICNHYFDRYLPADTKPYFGNQSYCSNN